MPLITIKDLRENTFSAQNIIFFLLARLFNFLSFSHFFLGSYHTYYVGGFFSSNYKIKVTKPLDLGVFFIYFYTYMIKKGKIKVYEQRD